MAIFFEHRGKRPHVHDSAYVAPTAVLCGDVTIGAESRVLFGAVITGEGGPVSIGSSCVIMEHAVIRGVNRHPVDIADHVLVGPHAHLSGCVVENEVFIATGASIFNGAHLESKSTVRINGVVHVRTRLSAGTKMPIGWIAVGDPAQILPPSEDKRVGELLLERGFGKTVFGLDQAHMTLELTQRYASSLHEHMKDRIIENS